MGRITHHGGKPRRQVVSPLALHIGSRLLKLRQRHSWTMRQVCEATNLSVAFVCQVENGQSCPSADTLWKLAEAFGVKPQWFFEGFVSEAK